MVLKVMPMLALVAISVPAICSGSREHELQPLGQRDGVRLALEVLAQHGELVAAQPRHHVARAHVLADAPRHLDQEGVAGAVAHAVVDQLEAVEVEEHHREAALRRRRLTRSIARARCSWKRERLGRPVRLSWKAMCCSRASALRRARDVLHLHDQAGGLAAGLVEEAAVQRHPDVAAVAVAAAQLGVDGVDLAARARGRAAPRRRRRRPRGTATCEALADQRGLVRRRAARSSRG